MANRDNYSSAKKSGKHGRNYLGLFIAVFISTIVLVTLTVFGVSLLMRKIGEREGLVTTAETENQTTPPVDTSAQPVINENTTAEESTAEPVSQGEKVTVSVKDAALGMLALVNADHEYTFPELTDFITIYERKNRAYKVASSEIELRAECIDKINEMMTAFSEATGLSDINVTNGYRDYETQMELYSAYVTRYGLTAADGNIASGGCSDHNTGLGFDLSVYTADGLTHTLDYKADYAWITDNCYKYGFVRRYEPAKSELTGIKGEEWHFRYVGAPHAYYMKKNDLCLEEYITLLSGYTTEGEHLIFSDDAGSKWELYTLTPSNSGEAEITLPPEAVSCTAADTNTGAMIITIDITAKS